MKIIHLKIPIILILFILANFISCEKLKIKNAEVNQIKWKTWDSNLFKEADKNKKLIFCYFYTRWNEYCHTVDYEYFIDKSLIRLLNQKFLSVKIDIVERPDLDSRYSQGIPFFTILDEKGDILGGMGLIPLQQLKSTLEQVSKIMEKPDSSTIARIKDLKINITKKFDVPEVESDEISIRAWYLLVNLLTTTYDSIYGGWGTKLKFPNSEPVELLMYDSFWRKDSSVKRTFDLTLNNITNNSLFDHIRGGFFRYSKNTSWTDPAFEKTLEVNAELINLLSKAIRFFNLKELNIFINKTLNFLENNLKVKNKDIYYEALDCKVNNDYKGNWYRWNPSTVRSLLLPIELTVVSEHLGIGSSDENVLTIPVLRKSLEEISEELHIAKDTIETIFNDALDKLIKYKNKKGQPDIIKNIYSKPNCDLAKAFLEIYRNSSNNDFLNKAEAIYNWLKDEMLNDEGFILHKYNDKKLPLYLSDQISLLELMIELYFTSGNSNYLNSAINLSDLINS